MLRGKIQMDDAYLGGEHPDGKAAGDGSEGKIPILAAVTLDETGHPIDGRISAVSSFSSATIADWAKRHLPGTTKRLLSPAASTSQPAAVPLDQGDANNLKNSKSQKKRQEILLTPQTQLLSDSKDRNESKHTPAINQIRCQTQHLKR